MDSDPDVRRDISVSAPRRGRLSRGRWWVLAVAAVLLVGVGVAGGLVGATVARRGEQRVCPAATVATRGLPSVVTIEAQGAAGAGVGSGEVIRSEGRILTNDHVIAPAGSGGRLTVVLEDGTRLPARIVGRDPATDLAVLGVDAGRALPAIEVGSSAALEVGQPVVALGAPLGLSSTVTTGVVSALGRTVRVPSEVVRTALLAAAIQTDAAINPGNSGGALVDCSARLVGVPTAGATVPDQQGNAGGGSIGIGFAIPVDFALRIADQLIARGSVDHAYLGARVAPLAGGSPAEEGLYVVGVTPAGPAEAAGIRPGDVLTAIDGVAVTDADQLDVLSVTRRPGERVRLTYRRGGASADTTATLAARPGR
jgi:putative serine protease PepD